ncbi:hypothetical protein MBLNU459_g5924t2 [Dothideomycetes sp. NU459]
MDIDDILASVSAPRIPQRTLDLQALTRAWVSERTAPELLPYPASLVERVMERLRMQGTSEEETGEKEPTNSKGIETVEDMTGDMNPKSNFSLIVIQTELERFKFLLRSLLRSRIAKIDKFPQHYLARAQQQQSAPEPLLSQTELQYLSHHSALLSHHYSTSFLSSFPAALQRLDDTSGGISMVDRPDDDSAVFCRVLRDCGTLEVQSEQGVSEVALHRGDVWVLRWGGVRDRVVRGDVEMI